MTLRKSPHAIKRDARYYETRCAALEQEVRAWMDLAPDTATRIRELEAAVREAAWIICDHGPCEAIEWSLRRGNWEDKYAAKATAQGKEV